MPTMKSNVPYLPTTITYRTHVSTSTYRNYVATYLDATSIAKRIQDLRFERTKNNNFAVSSEIQKITVNCII